MSYPITILLLEDSIYDAELTLHELRRQGIIFTSLQAQDKEQFLEGLKKNPDIILADYSLPQFNANEAIKLMKENGYNIPIIVISGTIGEELAVEMMRYGASDYLMKDRLGRLSTAVKTALESAELRVINDQYMHELEESNARYKSLFDDSPISLWEEDFSSAKALLDELTANGVHDLRKHFEENHDELVRLCKSRNLIAINQATVELYKSNTKEEAYADLSNIKLDRLRNEFMDYALTFYEGATEYHTQTWHTTTQREPIFVSIHIAIAPNHLETWDKVYISIVDLTEQAQAQQQVAQSELLLSSMIDSSLDWIYVKGKDHRYKLANDTFAKGIGFRKEDILEKSDEEIDFSKETAENFRKANERILASRQPETYYNETIDRNDGREFHFSTIKTPLYDADGNAWGVMGISRDISDMLKAEAELAESRQNYESLFNSLVDSMFVHDMNGKILVSNPIAQKRLGYTAKELSGKYVKDITAFPKARDIYLKRIELLKKIGHINFTTRHKAKDGTIIPLEVSSNIVEFRGEEAVMSIMRDISNVIEVEAALEKSAEQYETLFNTVPDVIILIDMNGEIMHVNQTTCNLTGYSYEELTQMNLHQLTSDHLDLHHDSSPKNDAAANYNLTMAVETKTTETRLLDITSIQTEFANRKLTMLVGRDQTDRILAERNTARTEGLMRTMIDTIPQPIFVVDEDATYVMVNENLAELYQARKEDILGKTNSDLAKESILSPEEAAIYHENAMIPLMTREPFFRPVDSFTDPDGIKHWFQIYTTPFRLPDKSIWVVGVGNEITHQMQAQTRLEALNEALERRVEKRTRDLDHTNLELQKAKEQLESILAYSPDGFLLLDADMNIQAMNPTFTELTGVPAEIGINKNIMSVVGDRNKPLIQEAINKALETGETISIEHPIRHATGIDFDSLTTISPILAEDILVGLVAGIHDISKQKEVQRMKDAFVSNVSHELRTPITNFICNLELIRMNPKKQDLYLERLDLEIIQLKNIIEDLLRLSRFDQNATDLIQTPFDVNILCQDFSSLRTPLAEQKNLSMAFIPCEGIPKVVGDYGLISQVLSILLTNAINYTPEGGEIIIRSHDSNEKHPGMVGFSVSDNGPGISADEKEKIFERFYRGQAGIESQVSGTGLGLPIAHEIIERHHGIIEVFSNGISGEGTSFIIWLPINTRDDIL